MKGVWLMSNPFLISYLNSLVKIFVCKKMCFRQHDTNIVKEAIPQAQKPLDRK